jgi:hypothetical protein
VVWIPVLGFIGEFLLKQLERRGHNGSVTSSANETRRQNFTLALRVGGLIRSNNPQPSDGLAGCRRRATLVFHTLRCCQGSHDVRFGVYGFLCFLASPVELWNRGGFAVIFFRQGNPRLDNSLVGELRKRVKRSLMPKGTVTVAHKSGVRERGIKNLDFPRNPSDGCQLPSPSSSELRRTCRSFQVRGILRTACEQLPSGHHPRDAEDGEYRPTRL